jgi:UPF0716 protein FxsA
MNTLLLLIIGIPAIEILVMIKVGQHVGALNTILLIFLTAIIGIYYAKIQGINTLKSGFLNLYQNKIPIYEMVSGASIAIAASLLILPGFLTDVIGFTLLFPFTRKIIIKSFIKKEYENKPNNNVVDGEIIEEKKDDKDEI